MIFSALINILTLTGSFYMLEVYDRVIPSRSVPTLVALSLLALLLFTSQGVLDVIRSRILVRIGSHLDDASSERIFELMTRGHSPASPQAQALQPMRDVEAIKSFLSSSGPAALLDLPWLPIYIIVMFLFHWLLGIAAVIGAAILILFTLVTEIRTRKPTRNLTRDIAARSDIAIAGRRNAEVIAAMGMGPRLAQRYRSAGRAATASQAFVSDLSGGMGSASRIFRLVLQSAVLGIGAMLVIRNESTAGIMITGSILIGRALAPVDQAIANWKGFVAARQGWARLTETFRQVPSAGDRMPLPKPCSSLNVERLAVLEPGGQRALIRDVSFRLKAGQSLCIIGPSGAGKSTLARALVNAWRPAAGRVELDGAALDQWPIEDLGNEIGFLPQDVELFSGSIAENISRHLGIPDPLQVTEAATTAGVHAMITHFKEGYQTQVGEGGNALSAGQRQRIALARAIYGKPFLVVLDEPNSNLDAEGDAALLKAVTAIRDRGGIVVAVSHRPGLLEAFDLVLILNEGQVTAFGPRDEVIGKHVRNIGAAAPVPRKPSPVVAIVSDQDRLADGQSRT
jgi:ATP-binding cassette subfamily C protein